MHSTVYGIHGLGSVTALVHRHVCAHYNRRPLPTHTDAHTDTFTISVKFNLVNLVRMILSPSHTHPNQTTPHTHPTQACQLLASSNIINLLYQLWKEKTEDVEIVLQLIHCFFK